MSSLRQLAEAIDDGLKSFKYGYFYYKRITSLQKAFVWSTFYDVWMHFILLLNFNHHSLPL